MEAIVKALGRFFRRDIPYMFAGVCILAAIAYATAIPTPADLSPTYQFIILGTAYVLGFLVQEIATVVGVVNTSLDIHPNKFHRWLYRRWCDRRWNLKRDFDGQLAYLKVYRRHAQEVEHIDRVNSLRHLSATVGPAWFVTSVICGVSAYFHSHHRILIGAGIVCVLSWCLMLCGHLQGMGFIDMLAMDALLPPEPSESSTPTEEKTDE